LTPDGIWHLLYKFIKSRAKIEVDLTSSMKTKVVFLGTPEFAVPVLQELIDDPAIEVELVITQPDRPVGRGGAVTPPPVKILAEKAGLTIMQPDNVNGDDIVEMIEGAEPDYIVVVAYGQILGRKILKLAKKEILNVHASLLPKYRGASPIQYANLSGDKKTGVSIMGVRRKMDAGPVYLEEKVSIDDKNFVQLSEELTGVGAEALIKVVNGSFKAKEQDESKATYCKKVSRKDGEVSFAEMDAEEIVRRWRAFYGWPGIYTYWDGKRLKLLEVEVSDVEVDGSVGMVRFIGEKIYVLTHGKTIEIKRLQLEGKKEMSAGEFMRGYEKFDGTVL